MAVISTIRLGLHPRASHRRICLHLIKRFYATRRDINWSRCWKNCNNSGYSDNNNTNKKSLKIGLSMAIGAAAATCCSFLYILDTSVRAMDIIAQPPSYPWIFDRLFMSFDHMTLRRGWEVYKTVCSMCHGVQYLRFMDLANVTHTPEEAVAIASEYEVKDGPDDEGEYFMRAARLSDPVPSPYPNEEAARAANFGFNPPDLSYIVLAKRNGRNYIFSLLTGYMEPPAGVNLTDGQHFNPYFLGGVIGMGQMIQEGIVEYEDGTPATLSQMSKDVVEFLSWTSSQEHDTRKVMLIKALGISTILIITVLYMKKNRWSHITSRHIAYMPKKMH